MEPEQDKNAGAGGQLRGFLRRRKQRRHNLRMTPMIDVIFLLLIFFVLTARFRIPEQFLGSILPDNKQNEQRADVIEPLVLYIGGTDTGCEIQIGTVEKVVIQDEARDEGIAAFANKLADVLAAQKRTANDPMEIECDDDVEWDYLVKIYNVLYAMGIEDVTFDIPEAATLDIKQ